MNILTFDIEEWFIYERFKIGKKEDWSVRLEVYLRKVLDLLDEHKIKATFFILGEVAKSNPEVVSLIASRKHHLGCHSFSHKFWKETTTPEEFIEDTRKALDTIENIVGEKINTYRAPVFSITEKNSWILEILVENGIQYDCSIFPATRNFGGFASYKTKLPSIIEINGSCIKEFPISPATVLGREMVFSGGGYFRMFPYRKIKSLTLRSDYVMTYFHLKDFDKEQIRTFNSLEGKSAFLRYFEKYYGLKGAFSKFCRYVSEFDFISVEQADEIINWKEQPVVKL